ncbi:kinase-like domain-containing protein [Rhizophagus irregularis DAOM 181602=DAOM 197198]|nr:kinase-like domain-containing protein [Rhizophagus irregularis DAOM 181602=DAOM 197198]
MISHFPLLINEIPHTQITKFKYVAEGGFGIIYKATWLGQDVAVKRFLNSQNISKYFLNEVKALFQCYSLEYIIEVYGITQDIETKDFMLVMKMTKSHQTWLICDLGLSLPANYSLLNNEVYGVTPYIAPEIFKGGAISKESDVYSIEGFNNWYHKNKYVEIFKQAEQKRLELIQLKQLGPEFSEKPHSGAVYTVLVDH